MDIESKLQALEVIQELSAELGGDMLVNQSDENIEKGLQHVKDAIENITEAQWMNTEITYTCMLVLATLCAKCGGDTFKAKLEGLDNNETGEVYGDFEVIIRKIKSKQGGRG